MPPKTKSQQGAKKAGGKRKDDGMDLEQIEALLQSVAAKPDAKEGAAALKRVGQALAASQQAAVMREHMRRSIVQYERDLAASSRQPITQFEALPKDQTQWFTIADGKHLRYEQFTVGHMDAVMKLFAELLPEPYSVFTYEHFLLGWPDLGILVFGHEGAEKPAADFAGELVGCIVSKVSPKAPMLPPRGYIAMLAVRPAFRGHRIGQRLVKTTVELMKRKGAYEVLLETPVKNERALKLYTDMGFATTKYLTRYYLDGADAVRLKLWFQVPQQME
jgi:ribosomal protein S18 acetylase RimI-like enzyme